MREHGGRLEVRVGWTLKGTALVKNKTKKKTKPQGRGAMAGGGVVYGGSFEGGEPLKSRLRAS